jgi:hypothetical protein
MSPSNFPATNPEVIRTATRTRSNSLVAGIQNLIGPVLLGIDLETACKRYEEEHGARSNWAVPVQPGTNSNCARSASENEDWP